MCDWEDAPSGDLPLTDGAYQGAFQFDDVFPYLGPPTPGSPNDRKERTANLIENWVVDPLFGNFRGWSSMRRAAGEDTEYEVKVRTNVVPPYRVNITQGSPLGPNVWFFQVDQPGEQFKLLKEEDYVGPDPPLVFEERLRVGRHNGLEHHSQRRQDQGRRTHPHHRRSLPLAAAGSVARASWPAASTSGPTYTNLFSCRRPTQPGGTP